MTDYDARKVTRFAAEALWVQQQTIFSLMDAVHAMENLMRRDAPETFAKYEALKNQVEKESAEEQRSTIREIQTVVEFARKIARPT